MRRPILPLALLAGLGLIGPVFAQTNADPKAAEAAEAAPDPAARPLDRSKVPDPEVVVPSTLPPPAPSAEPGARDGTAPAR